MDVTEDVTNTLRAGANHPPLVFENHSQDSRYTGPLDVAQTVLSAFGTGGNNVPFVVETPKTLKIRSGCEGGGKGALVQEDKSATLATNNDQTLFAPVYHGTKNSHLTRFTDDPTLDTLVATEYKGPPVVCVEPYYIVRRLTPTECARLQGFPDHWGWPYVLDDMDEETFEFWKGVRQTYGLVNGRQQKDYTKKQILTWYNKLHTDSAEYKMWGNGIALPTALYVMQGITDALEREGAEGRGGKK